MTDRNEAFEDYMERTYGFAWNKMLTTEFIYSVQAGFFGGHDAAVRSAVGTVLSGPAKGDRFAGPAGEGL